MSNELIRFEAIRPPELDTSYLRIYMIGILSEYGKRAVSKLRAVTKYWHSNRPEFDYKMSTSKNENISVVVTTDNPVFHYVNKGVDGHLIYPKIVEGPKGTAGTYVAGSIPNTLITDPLGGRKILDGNYLNLYQIIDWPGIQPRQWTNLINEDLFYEYNLQDKMRELFAKFADKIYKDRA